MTRNGQSWPRLAFALLASLALWLQAAPPARAVSFGECTGPVLFGAAVNVVLLPYTYVGRTDDELSQAARNIATLIQFDSLGAARYGSIGIVNLRGSVEACNADQVLARLTEWPVAVGEQRAGAGVAVLWGRFFEDEGGIYVQSYLSLVRYKAPNDVHLRWPFGDRSFDFVSYLPTSRLAFAPRRIERSSLSELNRRFGEANIVRMGPSLDAPPLDLDLSGHRSMAYGVEAVGDGWLRLVPYADAPSGYVRLGSETSAVLKEILPELYFLDGLAGYLTYRAKLEQPKSFEFSSPDDVEGLIAASMDHYRKEINPAKEPMPVALSLIIPPIVELLRADNEGDPLRGIVDGASERFDQAVSVAPGNADLVNLDAIARLYRCCAAGAAAPDVEAIDTALFRALALAPRNARIVANIEAFYELLLATKSTGPQLDARELEKRLAAIRRLKQRLELAPGNP